VRRRPGRDRRRQRGRSGARPGEDAEINQRIHDAGSKVYLSKKIVVHYFPRASFAALAKQYFKYGKGRARTLHKHKKFLTLRPAIPFFFVVGGAALLATTPWQPVPLAPWAFGAYALATAVEAARVVRKTRTEASAWPLVWGIFPVLHAAHGVGFAVGLVEYALRPDWTAEPEQLGARSSTDTGAGAGAKHATNGVRAPVIVG